MNSSSENPQFQSQDWPFFTSRFRALPFTLKFSHSDFQVEEIPAYEPCGEGEHVYLFIEKKGLTTHQAVQRLSRYLKVPRKEFGIAGLKDARGVTRQWISYRSPGELRSDSLDLDPIKVLCASRHRNKLKIGHLKGNRFIIKLRGIQPEHFESLKEVAAVLETQGFPNYFGTQRFGNRSDNWQIGRALIKKDYETAVQLLAGTPRSFDPEEQRRARELFSTRHYQEAGKAWPQRYHQFKRICQVMAVSGGNAQKAMHVIDKNQLWFYITSFQSWMFNHVLAKRIDQFPDLYKGDLAFRHDNGAVFHVEDLEKERPRQENFEISPSGPLFGFKMTEPTGEPAEIEKDILNFFGLEKNDFYTSGRLKCQGGRRSLRGRLDGVFLNDGEDEQGTYFQFGFNLQPGCYATMVLREIGKEMMIDAGGPQLAGMEAHV